MGAGIALAAVIGMAGCSVPSTPVAEHSASTVPTGSPTASAAAATVDFGSAPDTTGLPACSAVLPASLVSALVPGSRAADVVAGAAHVSGTDAFVVAAGGIVCDSSNGVTPLDDHVPGKRGEAMFEGVRLSVLPGALTALAAHRAFDGRSASPECNASDSARVYCGAEVSAGDAWVSLTSTRLQDDEDATPDQARPAFDALVAAVVEQVRSSPLGRTPDVGTADDGSITACDAGKVNAVTDRELAVGPFPNSSTAPELEDFARNRVHGDACVFVGGTGDYPTADGLYAHVPGGGWIVERRLATGAADRSDRLDLDGLGEHDAAWRTCDTDACTVDVVHDGDWTHYLLFSRAAPETSDAVGRWVGASFAV